MKKLLLIARIILTSTVCMADPVSDSMKAAQEWSSYQPLSMLEKVDHTTAKLIPGTGNDTLNTLVNDSYIVLTPFVEWKVGEDLRTDLKVQSKIALPHCEKGINLFIDSIYKGNEVNPQEDARTPREADGSSENGGFGSLRKEKSIGFNFSHKMDVELQTKPSITPGGSWT